MIRITVSKDCGNSPKNIFLQKMTIASAGGEVDFLRASVTEDIRWNTLGGRLVQGKQAFVQAISRRYEDSHELIILHVMTHGKAGAVDSRVSLNNGKVYAFCDVYEFNNARGESIKEITSYEIEVKE